LSSRATTVTEICEFTTDVIAMKNALCDGNENFSGFFEAVQVGIDVNLGGDDKRGIALTMISMMIA
jgi:hypothetical protein